MIDIIAHRINTIEDLKSIPEKYGIEVDIRSFGNKLVVHHDPFKEGDHFDLWIKYFKHKILILNVKEEGLEDSLIKILNEKRIENYFFLDQSFPFLIKNAGKCNGRSAIRYSEFESINTAINIKKKINWVWLDCFNYLPIEKENINLLKNSGFKICIVSPELQGRDDNKEILEIYKNIKNNNIYIDAVCTKKKEFWSDIWEIN